MAKVGKLPKIPTPDAFRRAIGKVRDVEENVKPTDTEIAQFVALAQRAVAAWPEDVPYEMLEVMVASYGTGEATHNFERDTLLLTLRDGEFLAIADDMGVNPGDTWVLATITTKADKEYQDDLEFAGWVVDDSAPFTPKGLRGHQGMAYAIVMQPPFDPTESLEAEGDLQPWAWSLANAVIRAEREAVAVRDWFRAHEGETHPRIRGHRVEWYEDDDPRHFDDAMRRALGKNVGLNADWSVSAWVLDGANWSQGGVYLTHEDNWSVVQRYYPENDDADEIPEDVEEEREEGEVNDDIITLLGPLSSDELQRWANEQPVEAHTDTDQARSNPKKAGKSFFVDDGSDVHGPYSLKEMCLNNDEHPDLCAALKKMKDGQELHVGGGAQAVFVIRCMQARTNPVDAVVCKKHGWRHAPNEECIKCVDDKKGRRRRRNPATIGVPSIDELLELSSQVETSSPHTDEEIAAFADAVARTAAVWPSDVPTTHLFVSSTAQKHHEDGGWSVLLFADDKFQADVDADTEGYGPPAALQVHANFKTAEYEQYGDAMKTAGWEVSQTPHGFVEMRSPLSPGLEREYAAVSGGDVDEDFPADTDDVDDRREQPFGAWRKNPDITRWSARPPWGDTEATHESFPGRTRVQSLVFDAEAFSASSAKSWAKDRGFAVKKTDKRDNTIRIRQDDPAYYADGSFRTIQLADGVQAIIGLPKD